MSVSQPRIGYVMKCYPRYSETFIVNEILAHEAAGVTLDIFTLRHTTDTHFQNAIARVRAPVTYLPTELARSQRLWELLEQEAEATPGAWTSLQQARGADVLDVFQALTLAREVRSRRITHLHAHFGNAAASVARLAARFAGIPYTFTAHAKDIFHESVDPVELQQKLADAAAVVTVSDYNRAYLAATYGPAAARVERIYNGLELDGFPYRSPEQRPPAIVTVGRLVEKKGFTHLIDACARLAARGRTFTCRIAGGGRLEAELRGQIEALGLQHVVELLGPRPQAEVIRLLHEAAVFAAPCVHGEDGDRDGMPTVLLEAMALGTPCVSTPVTGIPEAIRPGITGLLVPEADPVTLAGALERLLDEPELRVALAQRARQLIEQEFDVRRSAAHLRAVFTRCAPLQWQGLREAV